MQGTEIDRDDEVRQLVYRIWQEAGCPAGAELQHWLKAEEFWLEQHSPENRTKPSKGSKPRPNRAVKRDL